MFHSDFIVVIFVIFCIERGGRTGKTPGNRWSRINRRSSPWQIVEEYDYVVVIQNISLEMLILYVWIGIAKTVGFAEYLGV